MMILRPMIAIFAITISLLSGCGIDKTYRKTASLGFSENLLDGGTPLDDSEMAVALRICYALRSKRTKFLAEMLESSFNFTYQTKNCEDQTSTPLNLNTTLRQLIIDGPMSYEALGVNFTYMREVQTDINGELSQLCSQIFKGETPLNFKEINNEYYEYIFTSSIYDTVEINIGAKPTPSSEFLQVNRMLRFEVLTNQQSSGDYLGLVVKNSRYFPCEGTSRVRSQEQIFMAP
jgi:hypothetical protein